MNYDKMVSFSQNREDVLLRRLFAEQKTGFYIDIGASDPVIDSVTCYFYMLGWRGINIEPSPQLFQKIQHARPLDTNVDCLVGERNGSGILYDFPLSGLSTTSLEMAEEIVKQGAAADYHGKLLAGYNQIEVEQRRLDGIISEYFPVTGEIEQIDFLKVDCEGAERAVLLSNNWRINRPKVVLVEAIHPNSTLFTAEEWENILLENGYRYIYFDGLNRWYFSDESGLDSRLIQQPLSVFDNFIDFKVVLAQQEAAQLQQQLKSVEHSNQLNLHQVELLKKELARKQQQKTILRDKLSDTEQQLDNRNALFEQVVLELQHCSRQQRQTADHCAALVVRMAGLTGEKNKLQQINEKLLDEVTGLRKELQEKQQYLFNLEPAFAQSNQNYLNLEQVNTALQQQLLQIKSGRLYRMCTPFRYAGGAAAALFHKAAAGLLNRFRQSRLLKKIAAKTLFKLPGIKHRLRRYAVKHGAAVEQAAAVAVIPVQSVKDSGLSPYGQEIYQILFRDDNEGKR